MFGALDSLFYRFIVGSSVKANQPVGNIFSYKLE